MGLGKSLQVIAALTAYFNLYGESTAIIVCPAVCVRNWYQEFERWLSKDDFELLNPMILDNKKIKTLDDRCEYLKSWHKNGVLIIGYEMLRGYILETRKDDNLNDPDEKEIFSCLCNPGPDIIILDEGHRIKDDTKQLAHVFTLLINRHYKK